MSIQINNNFDYKGNQPNFERDQFETLELMRSADERSLDNGHISYCEETGKHYVFNENNDIDVETGKWRLLIENPENLDTNKQDKTDNALDTTDKTVVGAINEINGNTLDNVTFSADYKNIIINRKNGLNPYTIPIASIINNAKIIELNDVDSTDIGNGKTLVYDGATQKHKYVDSTGTDELVKMDSTTDAKHLSDLIDKQTIVNDNGVLKVKKLDGQEVTIAEINHLKGLTMNVMDLVNAFANGGVKVYERTMPTYADLLTLDRSGFIDEIKYFVYVQSDETHGGAKTTYLCDKTSETFFGNADSQRNFITNPIDLANEVTGKLGTSNIDVDTLWKLLTINDTYKTLTTKDEVFGTHGAKALYDELVAEIGNKANATDLTTHTSDTDIHITSSERTAWNKKANDSEVVKKTDITTKINSTSTNTQVPTAKTIYDNVLKNCSILGVIEENNFIISENTDLNNIITEGTYRCKAGSICATLINCPITNQAFKLVVNKGDSNFLAQYLVVSNTENFYPYVRTKHSLGNWGKWKKLCATNVADVGRTKFTLSDETNYALYPSGRNCYYIKNGIVSIGFDITVVSSTVNTNNACYTFPFKPLLDEIHSAFTYNNNSTTSIILQISPDGILYIWGGETGKRYTTSFSFSVAES